MRVPHFCFVYSAASATVGMSAGIWMGIAEDFTVAPAHAHLNLLGWVTMMLYGLYHRAAGAADGLVRTQVALNAAGVPLMAGGLAAYLASGNTALVPFVIAGSLLCFASMILFGVVVLRGATRADGAATGSWLPVGS